MIKNCETCGQKCAVKYYGCSHWTPKQQTETTGHWFPVNERLPEEDGYYLTTTMHNEVYCDYWNHDHFDRTEMVIAWMPLPKPFELDVRSIIKTNQKGEE